MYKILLATDQPQILEAYQAVKGWETLGYKLPRVVSSAEDAIALLHSRRLDAVAIALDQGSDRLMDVMMEEYPSLPLMATFADVSAVTDEARRLGKLLDSLNADYSNDDVDVAGMLQIARHDFFRELLAGKVNTERVLRSRLQNVRSVMDPDRPCVIVDLQLPEGDDFLSGRWHYGPERLEVALRNFFGAEMDGMRMLVSVMPDANARLLCCPIIGRDVSTDDMANAVTAHAKEAAVHVKDYLGLQVNILSTHMLPALTAIVSDNR